MKVSLSGLKHKTTNEAQYCSTSFGRAAGPSFGNDGRQTKRKKSTRHNSRRQKEQQRIEE
jgi:hypothetical protein